MKTKCFTSKHGEGVAEFFSEVITFYRKMRCAHPTRPFHLAYFAQTPGSPGVLKEAAAMASSIYGYFHDIDNFNTDNGSEFCNKHVDGVIVDAGAAHIRCSPYNPPAQGKVERHMRTSK